MGLYRNYKFRIRECDDTNGYLLVLDALIDVLDKKGLIRYDLEE